jgi:formate-dependent nitrite reductase cytochrome c552 subunit
MGRQLAELYKDIEASRESARLNGLSESGRADLEKLCRRAQFRWDWAFSENSTGFHNPDLIQAMLTEAEQTAEQARAILAAYAGH